VNNKTDDLSAGITITFQIKNGDVVDKIISDSSKNNLNSLHFDNTSLSDIIIVFARVYDKKIEIDNATNAQKKFTGDLDGRSFDEAINILCKSLNLECSQKNGVYQLKEKVITE